MFETKNIPAVMILEAKKLNKGSLEIVYKDGNAILFEITNADNPYVWRKTKWVEMR